MSTDEFDVIIVGGGLAGCSTALSLIRSSPEASFLVIDNADPSQFKIGESLPPGARAILQSFSPPILERLLHDAAQGVHTRCAGNASVWNSPELQETFAIMNPYGAGWHLDRAAFDESLRAHIRLANTEETAERRMLLTGAFISAQKDGHGWAVQVRSPSTGGNTYRSKWLVDASGRKASVAQKLGASTVKLDGLLAFYVVFSSTNIDQDTRTLIEATETGWWYSSLLSNQKRIVVFHTDDCDPSAKTARKQAGFMEMLHEDTSHISRTINDIDYRPMREAGVNYPRCTAAGSSFLSSFGSQEDQWCAVGDAAIAFDPLSSQGMITALRMGYSVGTMLSNQIFPSKDAAAPTDIKTIEELFGKVRSDYEQKRRYFYAQSMFEGDFWQRRK
ncbi:FAD/NAD(P)-binding domain-containing protein [Ceratobasidium sp. AG-I]|nr:FAD/NAD(P)-binding domain-containing protein [Ceratobasidium sp. AG-I]